MDIITDLEIVLILQYIKYDYVNGTFWVYSDKYPNRRLSLSPRDNKEWSVLDADNHGALHFPRTISHEMAKSMVVKFHNGESYF